MAVIYSEKPFSEVRRILESRFVVIYDGLIDETFYKVYGKLRFINF